jgi:hypothetical protein
MFKEEKNYFIEDSYDLMKENYNDRSAEGMQEVRNREIDRSFVG